jgi:glycosyltransferase involved in cell wall biosynthesis
MELPLISCKTITYGRVGMLEEALHSFLQQDYSNKEMVIVNDYPLQKLKFEHPNVRIFNMDETFETIGDKENFATKQCKGDIICQWDDDDVALPNHLNNVHKYFIPNTSVLHWKKGVYYNTPKITSIEWIGNSGIVFGKQAWEKIGGHPIQNAGYDMTFVQKLHKLGGVVFADPPREEVSWFYMWGGRGYHMSGLGDDKPGQMNVIKRHSDFVESLRRGGKIPTGDIELKPNWKYDYSQMLKDFVAR